MAHRSAALPRLAPRLYASALRSMPKAQAPATRAAAIANHLRSMNTSASTCAAPKPPAVDNPESVVLARGDGVLRTLTLNRPRLINAIDEEVVHELTVHVRNIAKSPNAAIILVRGLGRGLSAGGDIMAVALGMDSKDPEHRKMPYRYFNREFTLNYLIYTLEERTRATTGTKLYISLVDGITMGGGVGISVHAPFRIATERTLFAIPETGIGYYPDVGVLHSYGRLDGGIGPYCALTGARLSGADTYLSGLATHFVSSHVLDDLVHRLSTLPLESAQRAEVVAEILNEYSSDPFAPETEAGAAARANSPFLGDRRAAIDACFTLPRVEDIFAALEELANGDEKTAAARALAAHGGKLTEEVKKFAAETLTTLDAKAPRSLKITYEATRRAGRQHLDEVLRSNMRLTTLFCDVNLGRDFYNGVMHTLGRDPETGKRRTGRAPWSPATLAEVDDSLVHTLCFGKVADAHRAGLQRILPVEGLPPPVNDPKERRAREAEIRGLGPLNWQPKHNRFALPSEAELAALVEGNHPAAGSYVLEPDELLDAIRRHKDNKPAIELKVQDWLARTRSTLAAAALPAAAAPAVGRIGHVCMRTVSSGGAAGATGAAGAFVASSLPPTINAIVRDALARGVADQPEAETPTEVHGWVISARRQKTRTFLELTDGTVGGGATLQAVMSSEFRDIPPGTAVRLVGRLRPGRGKKQGQMIELHVDSAHVLGPSDPATYPLAGTLSRGADAGQAAVDVARRESHWKPRIAQFQAIARTRSRIELGIAQWFAENDYTKAQPPIITASDCEGGGETFRIAADADIVSGKAVQPEQLSAFWGGSDAHLSVSGQLHLEAFALGLSRAWSLIPVFRAEGSSTNRHLAEFWMLEAELAWLPEGMQGLDAVMDCAENVIRAAIAASTSTPRAQDDMKLLGGVDEALAGKWERVSYTDAIVRLREEHSRNPFAVEPRWGASLRSEHERWLANTAGKPVFVYNYPSGEKPFYMRENEQRVELTEALAPIPEVSGRTVACFDMLVPNVGELTGGSVREEREDVLAQRIVECGLENSSQMSWYTQDLRRYGGAPHGGFACA
ncbi:3-hydroxyisobutyryl-CoA hydrolase [Malassezia cuniculi]|uniref:3-hydroxyisobutyryl-CoA hydrolase n=1 Tax=Malassezia cuniculi TaxID=948313 RepID=A0AAF0ESV6_9BASI|nr:3-hydroxyisobutyryl-CoA hydrolase [Malassezia cuniculi]